MALGVAAFYAEALLYRGRALKRSGRYTEPMLYRARTVTQSLCYTGTGLCQSPGRLRRAYVIQGQGFYKAPGLHAELVL